MSGKMKWERVNTENRAHLHGSELIDPESRVLTSTGQLAPSYKPKGKLKLEGKRRPHSFAALPGCICGKPAGFVGLHKEKCPLSRNQKPATKTTASEQLYKPTRLVSTRKASAAALSLSDLVIRLNRVNLDGDLRRFVIAAKRRILGDRRGPGIDKELAVDAFQAILDEIEKYN
jgi:hypothetical protein